jgi:hypothetical protein
MQGYPFVDILLLLLIFMFQLLIKPGYEKYN